MSIVSSYISARAPVFRINAQAVSIMDSILAIGIGLAVRVVIDFVGRQDNRLTGTLVGLWEGVVMQHFLKKMPQSFDPYVAYGVRLFVDFLFTESLWRLVLTLVWTGLGVILADIAPAIWVEVGLKRVWRQVRRDLYILTQSVPTIPWFARPRTVRFSPSRSASAIGSAPPSVVTNTTQAPTTRPTHLAPTPRKRPVPGEFPGYASETETELGSVLGLRSSRSDASTSPGTTHHRFSSLPRRRATVETESELSYDLDEGNISSSDSGYTRTPLLNEADMPIIEDEEEREVVLDKGKQKEEETTPKQNPMVLPPTPSDTTFALQHHQDEPHEVQPPVAEVPNIPDDEDWENISRREALHTPPPGAAKDTPPTPPAKDVQLTAGSSSPRPQHVPPPSAFTNQEQLVDATSVPPPVNNTLDGPSASDNTPLPAQPEVNPWESLTWSATPTADPAPVLAPVPAPAPTTTQSGDAMEYSFLGRPPSYSQFQFADFNNSDVPSQKDAVVNKIADDLLGLTEPFISGVSDAVEGQGKTEDTAAAKAKAPAQAKAKKGPASHSRQPSRTQTPTVEQQPAASAPEVKEQQTPEPQTTEQPKTVKAKRGSANNSRQPSRTPTPAVEQQSPASAPEVAAQQTTEQRTVQQTSATPAPTTAAAAETEADDEPLPEGSKERLARALELRKEATELNKGLVELKRQLKAAWSDDAIELAVQKQMLVDASMKKVEQMNQKADRWYIAACDGKAGIEPPVEIDIGTAAGNDVTDKAEEALTHLLLKNQPTFRILTALKARGKAQRSVLIPWLDDLNLANEADIIKPRLLVVTLPTTPISSDS
ncbi:hypothetical protein FPV67DRAFT_1002296 [Lyophyllum atratum]|nr:hypothetical protein FPV67DRAFT_1002296 [Lyophyllum atratum]